ncbi:MAG: chemotaxis protein CheB [Lachnospiraceae bacterium]|nr:chemotaxis protein CheB [Lachnospiraceae bacterium]
MKKIVAIACSTGGPRALQKVVPYLNEQLHCPVLVVQHMPVGFTKSLADRLNDQCPIPVKESINGESIVDNTVYFAKAGTHLKVQRLGNMHKVVHSDEPDREGVKPCANYMYESLADSGYNEIICVVLTGMGADGSEGIKYLQQYKNTKVLIQDKESCAVFGMPGSILKNNIDCKICKLEDIGKEIVKLAEG